MLYEVIDNVVSYYVTEYLENLPEAYARFREKLLEMYLKFCDRSEFLGFDAYDDLECGTLAWKKNFFFRDRQLSGGKSAIRSSTPGTSRWTKMSGSGINENTVVLGTFPVLFGISGKIKKKFKVVERPLDTFIAVDVTLVLYRGVEPQV